MGALAKKLTEPLLLSQALERARALPQQHGVRARQLGAAARRRAAAARALRSEEHDVAALGLEQEAATLALAALFAARGALPESVPSAREAWARFDELGLADAPKSLDAARKLLEDDDRLAFDALGSPEARRARADIAEVLGWLLMLAEPRAENELKLARALRVGTLVACVAAATWLVMWLFVWPSNEALHKPVAISSLQRGSAPADNLTDGAHSRPLSVTERQAEPWARVDLLNPVAIERVAVFATAETSLPLILEVSDDDIRFSVAATRTEPMAKDRWVVGLGKKRARFVRLRHPGQGVLSLSEIEVWGKR